MPFPQSIAIFGRLASGMQSGIGRGNAASTPSFQYRRDTRKSSPEKPLHYVSNRLRGRVVPWYETDEGTGNLSCAQAASILEIGRKNLPVIPGKGVLMKFRDLNLKAKVISITLIGIAVSPL
jgi:hypothetical protein